MPANFCTYQFASPTLRQLVRSAWSVTYPADEDAMPGIIAPDAHVELVFQTGAPCRLDLSGHSFKSSPPAMLLALRRGVLRLHPTGANTIAALRLSPAVASVILGTPLVGFWNEPIDLGAKLPAAQRRAGLSLRRLRAYGCDDNQGRDHEVQFLARHAARFLRAVRLDADMRERQASERGTLPRWRLRPCCRTHAHRPHLCRGTPTLASYRGSLRLHGSGEPVARRSAVGD